MTHLPNAWRAWRFRERNRPGDHANGQADQELSSGTGLGSLPTAQELYTELVKNQVAPMLRANGLVGSNGRFSIKSETHWALLGFQKSAYSDRSEIRFTVNLLVVRRDEWDELVLSAPHYGPRPTPSVTYRAPVQSRRIGLLVEDAVDKWWRVFPEQDLDLVMADLQNDILGSALPWMRQQISTSCQ